MRHKSVHSFKDSFWLVCCSSSLLLSEGKEKRSGEQVRSGEGFLHGRNVSVFMCCISPLLLSNKYHKLRGLLRMHHPRAPTVTAQSPQTWVPLAQGSQQAACKASLFKPFQAPVTMMLVGLVPGTCGLSSCLLAGCQPGSLSAPLTLGSSGKSQKCLLTQQRPRPCNQTSLSVGQAVLH